MKLYSKTDIGRKREMNQDAYVAGEFESGAAFAVVCDGMGGMSGGNVASERAASIISDYIVKSYSPKMSATAIETMLRAAVETANSEIYDMAQSDPEYAGMGTTVVATLVCDQLAHIVHVGDSRAYLVGTSEIERLTIDHSVVQTMVDKGEISESEAKIHPKKNIITRAVGAEKSVLCDYDMVIKPDSSVLLLCTDGLTNFVEEEKIFSVVTNESPESCADRLTEYANEAGGGDNITVVLIY